MSPGDFQSQMPWGSSQGVGLKFGVPKVDSKPSLLRETPSSEFLLSCGLLYWLWGLWQYCVPASYQL